MNNHLRVFKFGGSSFRTAEDYNRIAREVVRRRSVDTDKLVIVVSAMYGVTNELRDLVESIGACRGQAARDAVLTTGEIVSANLMTIALKNLGISATPLSAYQLGIETDNEFGNASILSTDPACLRQALATHEVVVVTGAQGLSASGRPALLGRNSSDYSAVLVASLLDLDEVEIFSEVDGVYRADPNIVDSPQLMSHVGYTQLMDMSLRGAKVLHPNAVREALRFGIAVLCRNVRDFQGKFTRVGPDYEDFYAVTQMDGVALAKVASRRDAGALIAAFSDQDLGLFPVAHESSYAVAFCSTRHDLIRTMRENGFEVIESSAFSLVSILGLTYEAKSMLVPIGRVESTVRRIYSSLDPMSSRPSTRDLHTTQRARSPQPVSLEPRVAA